MGRHTKPGLAVCLAADGHNLTGGQQLTRKEERCRCVEWGNWSYIIFLSFFFSGPRVLALIPALFVRVVMLNAMWRGGCQVLGEQVKHLGLLGNALGVGRPPPAERPAGGLAVPPVSRREPLLVAPLVNGRQNHRTKSNHNLWSMHLPRTSTLSTNIGPSTRFPCRCSAEWSDRPVGRLGMPSPPPPRLPGD